LAPKAIKFGEMTLNDSHYAVLLVNHTTSYIAPFFWSFCRLLAKFSLLAGYLSLTLRVNSSRLCMVKLEISLYRMVKSGFRYLEPFRRGSLVWQTDRQTDI